MEQENQGKKDKITTIKLNTKTKERFDLLRTYRRESYDELMQKVLEILNICRANPERARMRLVSIDKEKKRNLYRNGAK